MAAPDLCRDGSRDEPVSATFHYAVRVTGPGTIIASYRARYGGCETGVGHEASGWRGVPADG